MTPLPPLPTPAIDRESVAKWLRDIANGDMTVASWDDANEGVKESALRTADAVLALVEAKVREAMLLHGSLGDDAFESIVAKVMS